MPDHTPPGSTPTRPILGSLSQNGPTGVIVASNVLFTVIEVVCTSGHNPEIEYVIVCDPGPAIAGSNVPAVAFEMPVPDHVPPGSTATSVTAGSPVQKGPTGVIVASEFAMTSIVSVSVAPQGPEMVYVIT